MKRTLIIFLLNTLLFSNLLLATKHLFVISGVIVNSKSSQKVENFIKMLEKKSGYPLQAFYVDSYSRLSQVLREHPDALAWTCGAPYVEDSIKDNQQLVAVPLFNNLPTYHSFIVTQKRHKSKSLLDFKNKIFTYSNARSLSGFIAPSQYLKQRGETLNDFFKISILAGSHERSIESIYRGLANVGAIDEYVWKEYTKDRPHLREKLHVIEKIGPFPFTPIVAGKQVSKQLILKLQKSLTGMSEKELFRFKKDFKLDGFVLKQRSFYQPIEKMLIELNIIPK